MFVLNIEKLDDSPKPQNPKTPKPQNPALIIIIEDEF